MKEKDLLFRIPIELQTLQSAWLHAYATAMDDQRKDIRAETASRLLPTFSQLILVNQLQPNVKKRIPKEAAVRMAIEYADELIKQLEETNGKE